MRPLTSILHVQDGDFCFASRVLKESRVALRRGWARRIDLLGLEIDGSASVEEREAGLWVHRVVSPPSERICGRAITAVRLVVRWWRFIRAGRRLKCDLIHCHSFGALVPSVVLGIIHRAPVVYDAHELESQAGQPPVRAALALAIELLCVRRVRAVICVSGSIADWYAQRFGIARPHVVRNVPDVASQQHAAEGSPLRDWLGIPAEDLLFLYQGALSPGRRIQQLLRVFRNVPLDRHLVFMGYGVLEPEISAAAAERPNIHLFPAVPPDQVLLHTRGADVGLCGVDNVCLSYYYSLPNKLFEYLHAGVPVLVPEWPEMLRIVKEHDCGWLVGEDDTAWSNAVIRLDRPMITSVAHAARAASAHLLWESEADVLLAAYSAALRDMGDA